MQVAHGQHALQIWCPCYNYSHKTCSKPIFRSDFSFQTFSYINPDQIPYTSPYCLPSSRNQLFSGASLSGKMTQASYGLKNSFQGLKSLNVRFCHWTISGAGLGQSDKIMTKWHSNWVIHPSAFLSLPYLAPSYISQLHVSLQITIHETV